MTDVHTAVQEVLRVRDAEREGDASTEDLLDAIAGLESATLPKDYRNDFDELIFTLDNIRYMAKTQEDRQAAINMAAAATNQLDFYLEEPRPLTAIRDYLTGKGYDQFPMHRDQQSYAWAVNATDLAFMEPHLKSLKENFDFTVRILLDKDGQPGGMFFDVDITRPEKPADDEAQAA